MLLEGFRASRLACSAVSTDDLPTPSGGKAVGEVVSVGEGVGSGVTSGPDSGGSSNAPSSSSSCARISSLSTISDRGVLAAVAGREVVEWAIFSSLS